MDNMEIPFKVLNTFRRGVVLQSVPEGLLLRLEPGDVILVSRYPKKAVTDIRTGVSERERLARLLPDEDVPADDWRHDASPRRSDYLNPKTVE